jgi:TolB-like protein/Flp pilus assembly protein TadD
MLFVTLGLWLSGSDSLTETAPIESIAVLPFTNESGDENKEFLSDGITESLINRLSQLPNLTVKARNSVFQYKGKKESLQTVGKNLSVQAVLLGHIAERGDNLMISVELVDVRTGNQIWGERYNRKTADIVSLQNDLVRDVSENLRKKLSGAEQGKLAKKQTESGEAYMLYLKGRFHWSKRTAKDLQKSIEYFEQAAALDPQFALAYSGMADSYVLFSGFGIVSPDESFPKAKKAAQKALEIDESLAEAHTALSYALFNYDWNFEESEKQIRRAIELNPNYATAYHWNGNANLLAMGKFDEAIASVRRAHELDPLSLIISADLATAYLYAGRFDEAVEQYKKTLELDDNFYYAHAYLGRTYMMRGEYAKALAGYEKAEKLGDDPRVLMLKARTYSKMSRRNDALKMLDKLKQMSKVRYISPYYFALVYTGVGDKDKAFEWLEKALREREGRMTLIKVDALLNELHTDPRFSDLLKRVGLEN